MTRLPPDDTTQDHARAPALAAETHRRHARACPVCRAEAAFAAQVVALLRGYVADHGADADGVHGPCECRLCVAAGALVAPDAGAGAAP